MADLLQVMTQRAQLLEKARVQLELHWVPRNRVEGNIVADKAAGMVKHARNSASNDLVHMDWDFQAEGPNHNPKETRYESITRWIDADLG